MMSTWIYPKLRPKQVSKDPLNVLFTVLITYEKKISFNHSLFLHFRKECYLSSLSFFQKHQINKLTNKHIEKVVTFSYEWTTNKQTNKHVEITLSPSFRLVSMTMDETSSCHIIFQKSLSVFCLGPIYQKYVCSITHWFLHCILVY